MGAYGIIAINNTGVAMFKKSPISFSDGATNWIYILVVLAVAGVVGLLVSQRAREPEVTIPAAVSATRQTAWLSLSTDKSEYQAGELVRVSVMLDLGSKRAAGVDVALTYDSKVLALQTKEGGGAAQGRLEPERYLNTAASVFETFPYFSADVLTGSVFFSALAKPREAVTGKHLVAELTFKALRPGTTTLGLDFTPSSTHDSNVAYLGQDILGRVSSVGVRVR